MLQFMLRRVSTKRAELLSSINKNLLTGTFVQIEIVNSTGALS